MKNLVITTIAFLIHPVAGVASLAYFEANKSIRNKFEEKVEGLYNQGRRKIKYIISLIK